MAAQGGMGGGLGQQHTRLMDRMLKSHTHFGKGRYRMAVLFNVKEVRRFISIWNIVFLSIVMIGTFILAFVNPEFKSTAGEICFQGSDCTENVHCWDNVHVDSSVFMPQGYYPTEANAVAQGQPWVADAAQFTDATRAMKRWYVVGFVLGFMNLAKEITHFACWGDKRNKNFDPQSFNRIEFQAAVKQFQDLIGFVARMVWFIWGIFIFMTGRFAGCRGANKEELPNPFLVNLKGGNVYNWTCLWFYLIAGLYLIRPFVFSGYMCCRGKTIKKEYNRQAVQFGFAEAEEAYENFYKKSIYTKKVKDKDHD